jgi:hypothetical protein
MICAALQNMLSSAELACVLLFLTASASGQFGSFKSFGTFRKFGDDPRTSTTVSPSFSTCQKCFLFINLRYIFSGRIAGCYF